MTGLHEDLGRVWSEVVASTEGRPVPVYPLIETPLADGYLLDPDQDRAARRLTGPVRVLAPAGSGKTRTLTARIERIVAQGIPAGRILALAFNTRAAEELAERLSGRIPGGVRTQTFHSLGYEIVRAAGGPHYNPEDEEQVRFLAAAAVRAHIPMPAHPGEARRLAARGLEVLLDGKSRLTPYEKMTVVYGGERWNLAAAFDEWIAAQKSQGLLAFTDMIYFAVRGLVENSALRLDWQNRFDFILVDEFQDLNAAQMLLLRILALPQNNLFVVGDDDQLIYAWRGAEAGHILDFESLYPGAVSVVLATNYRSGCRIVRHGRWLIENNPVRVAKDIRPAAAAEPGSVEIALRETLAEQARAAVDWVRKTRDAEGVDWSAFALLFRVNRDAERLEKALSEAEIPYTPAGESDAEAGDPPPRVIEGRVTLMTIHKSKGKEFPFVVYFNLSRGGGPAGDEADERRVAYVAMTRAGRGLLITADRSRPSPFLRELALNPGFDDFAEPYLERELNQARLRLAWRRRDWRGLIAAVLASADAPASGMVLEPAGAEEDHIDLLGSELHFRRVLGIEKKP